LHKFTNSNLIPVVNTIEEYNRIKNAKIDYAIHIDTGINRLGISSKDVKMLDLKNRNIKLVISHLSSSDEYKVKYNVKQKKLFNSFVNKNPKGVIFSLANAHGSILDKTYLYDMIRPGIGIYGCYENKKLEKFETLTCPSEVSKLRLYRKSNPEVSFETKFKRGVLIFPEPS